MKDFDDFAAVREPAGDVRRVVRAGFHHIGGDKFAFAADGNGDPVELPYKSARGEKKEAARSEFPAVEAIGDVANGNHATAAEDDAFDFGRFVRKAKDAAGRDKFGDLGSGHGEAAFTEADEHKGLRG